MKGLIAAGGHGTRLRPITYTRNKHTIPLANQSMIQLAINKLKEAGITDIIISVNEGDTQLREILGEGTNQGISLTYIEQKGGALGVAHVVMNAKTYLNGEDFIFYLGDNIIMSDVRQFVDTFYTQKLDCMLALAQVKNPQRFGVPVIKDQRIVEVVEKPEIPPSSYAVAGVYLFSTKIFKVLDHLQPSSRGEYEISDAITGMINSGYEVGYSEITGWWKDTGKPDDLLEANQLLLHNIKSHIRGDIDSTVRIQGSVIIEEGAHISGDSHIRGPVIIGTGTRIHNSYIGPFTSIGDNCLINNVEIEYSLIMHNVEIDTSKRISDSIIGNDVKIATKEKYFPRAYKLVIGDRSQIDI